MKTYQIAFVNDGSLDGHFDIVEHFTARGDEEANAYAEKNYADQEWYVLCDGENING